MASVAPGPSPMGRQKQFPMPVRRNLSHGVPPLKPDARKKITHPVYAADHEDAMKLAQMFYGYLLNDEDSRVKTTFMKMGGIEEIQSANQRVIEEIQNEVERTEERIKAQQDEIARKRMQVDAIQMLQMHTLSQMTRYEPSELLEEDTRAV